MESNINLLSRKDNLLNRGLSVLLLVTYGQCFGLGICYSSSLSNL
nr:MAG TPA: hypothetical protein [Bacteriophage sp.]